MSAASASAVATFAASAFAVEAFAARSQDCHRSTTSTTTIVEPRSQQASSAFAASPCFGEQHPHTRH